jgi:hypothetical protein
MKILTLTTILSFCLLSVFPSNFVFSKNVNKPLDLVDENKHEGKKVLIKMGSTSNLAEEKIKIKLVEVLEDSRCPKGARCIWAGNAKVKLELTKNETRTVELNTALDPKTISYSGYDIKILSLTPYPDTSKNTNKSEYEVTLELLKTSK